MPTIEYTIAAATTWEEALPASRSQRRVRLELTSGETGTNGLILWEATDVQPSGVHGNTLSGSLVPATVSNSPTFAECDLAGGDGIWVRKPSVASATVVVTIQPPKPRG